MSLTGRKQYNAEILLFELTQVHTCATNFCQVCIGVHAAVSKVVSIYRMMACFRMQYGRLVNGVDNVPVCV
jgi:hypothetical protein